ncbi:LysR substrate-binding domain-containing protein [Schumannella luteola]
MAEPFVVAFVLGVTPGKWARIWEERLPEHPLTLLPLAPADALAALEGGTAHTAFVRLPVDDAGLSAIPLYEEQPVVVMPKDHVLSVLDAVSPADLDGATVLDGEWAADIELVAANVGVTVLPQSVARALSRRDVVARPALEAPTTQVALVWRTDAATELTEEFIGIVRGRTVNSSRGAAKEPAPPSRSKPPRASARPALGKQAPRGKRPKRR